MSGYVRYELEDDTACISLNDGKVNVMSVEMMTQINAALDRAEAEAARVVLRSAEPDVFSAGFDVKILAAGDVERSVAMLAMGARLALRLLSFPLPTFGVVAGHAYPMGAFLLLACDLRIAAQGSYRIGLNEVAIGIVPPTFAMELARSRLHPAWLSRTVTLGEMYGPDEALQAGFVDHVVPPESLGRCLAEQIRAVREGIDLQAHAAAKRQFRARTIAAMQRSIDDELTVEAVQNPR